MNPKSKIATAGVAVALAILLIGGAGSLAYLNDTSPGPAAQISAGSLKMDVSGPVIANVATGSAPAGVFVKPTGAGPGIIPGIQAQTLTYTVTNTGSARATAKLTGTLSSTSTSGAYASVYPHVQVAVSIDGAPEQVVLAPGALTDTGFVGVPIPASSTIFTPGVARTVTVVISIPDSNGALARSVLDARAKALVSIQPTFTLTQTPIG